MSPTGTKCSGRLVPEIAIFAGYGLLAAVQTGVFHGLATHLYTGPDPTDQAWVLAWVSGHFLTPRMFDGNIFFPWPSSVLFNEPLLGPAALVTPLRLVTGKPILLFNVAILLGRTLASYGFYRLALKITADRGASLLAGIVIPYSSQQMRSLIHLNLGTLAGFPFMILGLFRLVDKPGPAAALIVGLAFVFEAGTSGYHAINAAVLAVVFASWRRREMMKPAVIGWTVAAVALAVVLLTPYVVRFVELKQGEGMSRSLDVARQYSVDPGLDLLKTRSRLWIETGLLREGRLGIFPGLTVLVFGALGLMTRSRYRWFLLAVTVVFLVLSFGPFLEYRSSLVMTLPLKVLMASVPPFDAIRHPVTFAVPAIFGAGLLATIGAARLGVGRRPWLAAAVLLFAVAETWSGWPPRVERPALPAAYAFLKQQPPGALMALPLEDAERYMWWAALHEMPMVNGEGAFEPRVYANLYRFLRREWGDPAMGNLEGRRSTSLLLERFPIDYVVLHHGAPPAMQRNIEATPERFSLLTTTADGDRIYRFRRNRD